MVDVTREEDTGRGIRVAVLGVGLIGGSIGLAARDRAGAHVIGYDPDADALAKAVELGAIVEPAARVGEAVAGADVVFVASPVGVSTELARAALAASGPDCLVSDVGSTKRAIVHAISDPRFVGGHPLAGAETAGVKHARVDLFDGATWYLTPSPGSPALPEGPSSSASASMASLERLGALIERFGARPVAIDAGAHDRLMASVSHLQHVFANVLVAQVWQAVEAVEGMEIEPGTLGAGPSFRDATRVAGANTAIWTDIYMSNRDELIAAIDDAIRGLGEVRTALKQGDADAVAAWNELARTHREQLWRGGLTAGS